MKEIRQHRKSERRVTWQAARLEGKVKNIGITPVKKPRKGLASSGKLK
jgi:hypothetical protein